MRLNTKDNITLEEWRGLYGSFEIRLGLFQIRLVYFCIH